MPVKNASALNIRASGSTGSLSNERISASLYGRRRFFVRRENVPRGRMHGSAVVKSASRASRNIVRTLPKMFATVFGDSAFLVVSLIVCFNSETSWKMCPRGLPREATSQPIAREHVLFERSQLVERVAVLTLLRPRLRELPEGRRPSRTRRHICARLHLALPALVETICGTAVGPERSQTRLPCQRKRPNTKCHRYRACAERRHLFHRFH